MERHLDHDQARHDDRAVALPSPGERYSIISPARRRLRAHVAFEYLVVVEVPPGGLVYYGRCRRGDYNHEYTGHAPGDFLVA